MGSNNSKKRRSTPNFDSIYTESENSSKNGSLLKKKKAKLKKNADAISISSQDSVSNTNVSYIPNGDLKNGGTLTNNCIIPSLNVIAKAKDVDNVSTCSSKRESVHDLRKDTKTVENLSPHDDISDSASRQSSNVKFNSLDQNENHTQKSGAYVNGDSDSLGSDMTRTTTPELISEHGVDYHGGSVLPRKGGAQDTLTRLMKNGIGTGKKSSLQLLFEVTRHDSRRKLCQLCDVHFLKNGYVAITSCESGKSGILLYSLDDGGRTGAILGEDILLSPRGICAGSNSDNIAVTDWNNKTVQFVNVQGELINQWKLNKFQHPGGIAINRDGRYIIVDMKRKEAPLGLYTPYGKLLRRFGTSEFDWPWHVTVDRKNRILVSERTTSMINVFDDVGQFLFKFGGSEANGGSSKKGNTDAQLNNPGGIAVDGQNNILVADTDNRRVALFSQEGEFLRTLLTTRFSRPISVAYDDGHLAVITDTDLRVYKTYLEKTSL